MILLTNCFTHQTNAYKYIKDKKVFALYMEMGTGKTRTILEYIYKKRISTIIYFCPVCLKRTVELELKKHIYNPLYFIESGQKIFPLGFQFYIIGIESINSNRVYLALHYLLCKIKCEYMVIVDESSFIKTFTAKRTNRIIEISKSSKYRAIMTGTPITQYYQDIFTQFKFLDPSIIKYRSYYCFCNRFLIYHEKFKNFIIGTKNTNELLSQISPYIFQIKKSDCINLPDKIYENYYCKLSYNAYMKYNSTKEYFINNIDKFYESENYNRISFEIFKLYIKLQRIVSNDVQNRIELLKNIIKGINKVCIICKFIKEINIIKQHFVNAIIYTGNETIKQRSEILNNINNIKILVMTFGVGSFGLNLSMFNNCIYYSNTFKYAERIQSEDRFHRIGQKNKVTYINIICQKTIDEIIYDNIEKKEDIKIIFENKLKNILKDKEKIKEFIKKL